MISSVAPFILGIVLQVGSAVGLALFEPSTLPVQGEAREQAKMRFALDVDATQSVPSLATIVAAVAVAPHIESELRGVLTAGAVVCMCFVILLFRRAKPNEYNEHTHLGLSPLNQVMIMFNVAAGLLIFWVN